MNYKYVAVSLRTEVNKIKNSPALGRLKTPKLPDHVKHYVSQLVKLNPTDLVVVTGPDGFFEFTSPSVRKKFGFTRWEFTRTPIQELVYAEDLERTFIEYRKQSDEGKTTFSFENRYVCKDGSALWLRWHSIPDLQSGLLIAIAKDITSEKLSEERIMRTLREANLPTHDIEKSLKILLDYKKALDASTIYARTNNKGVIEYANLSFSAMSGYPTQYLIGKNYGLFNSGMHPPEFFEDLWKTILSGKVWHGVICNQKNGYLVSAENLLNRDNLPQLMTLLEKNFGLDLQAEPDDFLTLQAFIKSPEFIQKINNHTKAEEISELIVNLEANPIDRFNQRLDILIKLFPEYLKRSARSHDGYYWSDSIIVPLVGTNGEIEKYSVIHVDYTEYKKIEKALVESHADEARAGLADVIAHEVNNYLASASGYSALAHDAFEAGEPDKAWDDLKQVRIAIKGAGDVMANILKAHREVKGEKHNLDIDEVALMTLRNMNSHFIKHSIEVLLNGQPWARYQKNKTLPPIYGDIQQLEPAFRNILKNAVESLAEGKKIHRKIEVQTALQENCLNISISNNGPAIPDEVVHKLFDPKESSKKKKGGNGLGLYMVKKYVRDHQGHIEVTGDPVQFKFFFPVSKQINTPAVQISSLSSNQSNFFKPMLKIDPKTLQKAKEQRLKIILIDDDESLHGVFKGAFRKDEFQGFTNLISAQNHLKMHTPDLIILDYLIKSEDGLTFAKSLKDQHYPAPIVMVSGNPMEVINGEDSLLLHLKTLGVEGFIAKPAEISTLMDMTMVYRLRKLLPRLIDLVDDQLWNLELWQKMLSPYPTRIFTSPDDALETFKNKPSGLVLSDKNLKVGSGVDLLREIRKISPATGLGLITGEHEGSIIHLRKTGEFDEVYSKNTLMDGSGFINLAKKYLGELIV